MNKPVTEAVKKAATGEYLSCMFLLLTNNNKFGPLKTELDNSVLMGKQECPSNILQAKQLMTNLVVAAGEIKQRREPAKAMGMEFVKTKE